MADSIKIGIADLNIVKPPQLICTIGLGSCVGIAIRDPVLKIGGLVHIMLPDSTAIKSNANIAKFADTGIPELVRMLEEAGCKRSRMEAKIAGGAQMFAFQNKSELLGIGKRNVEATKEALKKLGIPLKAEDTGDTYGRTVTYNPENGEYEVKTVGKSTKII